MTADRDLVPVRVPERTPRRLINPLEAVMGPLQVAIGLAAVAAVLGIVPWLVWLAGQFLPLAVVLGSVGGTIALLAAARRFKRIRVRLDLLACGTRAVAEVLGPDRNLNFVHPNAAALVLQFDDRRGDTHVLHTRRPIWLDPEQVVDGQLIEVLYDPANPTHFVVPEWGRAEFEGGAACEDGRRALPPPRGSLVPVRTRVEVPTFTFSASSVPLWQSLLGMSREPVGTISADDGVLEQVQGESRTTIDMSSRFATEVCAWIATAGEAEIHVSVRQNDARIEFRATVHQEQISANAAVKQSNAPFVRAGDLEPLWRAICEGALGQGEDPRGVLQVPGQ